MISMPFMNSYYISRSNQFNRGQFAGMYTMAWSAAQIIGSSLGSVLADKVGFFILWLLIGGICLLTSMGFYWLFSRKN